MKHDDVVQAISRLDEATKHLQDQISRPKNKTQTFKEFAGVVSLIVSLIAALYGAFSVMVLDPRKHRADDQARLAQVLTALWGVDMQANQAAEHGDAATIAVLTTQHQKLLKDAETLASTLGVGSPQDHFYVAADYELVNELQHALDHYQIAMTSAGTDLVLASTAEMRIGQLELRGVAGASAMQARQHFNEAERRLGDPKAVSVSFPLFQLLTVRAIIECKFGDTAQGLAARDRAYIRLDKIAAQDQLIDARWVAQQKTDFVRGLMETRCSASGSPQLGSAGLLPPIEFTNRLDLSRRLINLLETSDYSSIENEMNLDLRSKLPISVLRAQWEQISSRMGPAQHSVEVREKANANTVQYIVYASYDKGSIKLSLMYDATNHLSLLLVTPIFAD